MDDCFGGASLKNSDGPGHLERIQTKAQPENGHSKDAGTARGVLVLVVALASIGDRTVVVFTATDDG